MTHSHEGALARRGRSPEEVLRTVTDSPFSRYPVARNDLSEIIGVVRVKEYLAELASGRTPDLVGLAHDPVYVLVSSRVLTLLETVQVPAGMRFAVVVDEYGRRPGRGDRTNILEAIVGDIPTPGEARNPRPCAVSVGRFRLLDGLLPLDEAHA
jgi:putative hemolysin